MMFKILCLSALVACSLAQDQYPAGVSAASCPDYPYCTGGAINYMAQANPAIAYPAGVSAAACPNYPDCSITNYINYFAQANPAVAYPAGVSAAACPNYPYC